MTLWSTLCKWLINVIGLSSSSSKSNENDINFIIEKLKQEKIKGNQRRRIKRIYFYTWISMEINKKERSIKLSSKEERRGKRRR
mgnify:CR=1 FL=1